MYRPTPTRLLAVLCLAGLVCLAPASALAQATPEQVAELGKSLTPMGSPKAGNAEGTIPEWTGGISSPPEGWKKTQIFSLDRKLAVKRRSHYA